MHTTLASLRRLASAFVFALPVLALGGSAAMAQANAPGEQSLAAAQTRLRYTQEELDSALAKVKSLEKRLREAEDSAGRQQAKLEQEKAKVEKAKNDLVAAKTSAEQAQKRHEAASAEIQRLYKESQPAPGATKPQ